MHDLVIRGGTIVDGSGKHAQELAILAVVLKINILAVDRAVLGLEEFQDVRIGGRRDAVGVDGRCSRRDHSRLWTWVVP